MKNKKFRRTSGFTFLKEKQRCFMTLLMMTICSFGFSQLDVSGTVSDGGGIPLSGASVVEKGTTNGVQADFDGNFSITVVGQNATLLVSYLGFLSTEIVVTDNTVLSVVLQEDAQNLDEVVVVGYGTAKKKNITGAVTRVNLEDSPVALASNTSVLQAIRGATPGVNIGTQNSAGGTPNILVRGTNSLGGQGNNNPLIVLDGVIFLGSVNDINPSDIASIDILKDASTAVVYGSRAANGVILINTKKGKSNKPVIRFSSSTGVNRWQNKPELLNREDYLDKYIIQQNIPTVGDIVWEEEYRGILQDEAVDTDWIDLISRTGRIQKHNVSVSGNTEKTNYFFSGGYEDQEGVILGDEFNRITLRSRLQADVTDWLQVGIDGSYTNSDFSGEVANVRQAQVIAPIGYPYRYPGQPFNVSTNTSTDLERYPTANNVQSPLWGTDGTRDNFDIRNYFRLAANVKVKIPWIKGLTYSFSYATSVQYRNQDIFEYESYHITTPGERPYFQRYTQESLQQNLSQANGTNIRRKDYNYVVDNILNYTNDFGKSSVDLTLVATRDYRFVDIATVTGRDFSEVGNTTLGADGLSFAAIVETDYGLTERSNSGYLGRLSYSYDGRYSLNAAVRRDGASVFGADNKFGTFWSVGGAWTLTEENFIPESKFLNYLKINASYGTNGNQGLTPYRTLSGVVNGLPGGLRYAFGDDPSVSEFGIEQTTLGNSALGWESTTALNFGIHAALLNNRVSLDADIYFSETEDQIFNRNIPSTSGFGSILASLGRIDNNGVEIALNTKNIATKDFTWSSGITYWKNNNEVVSLFGDDNDGDGIEDDDIGSSLFIGESLGAIYGYEYIGVVQESDTQYIADNGVVPGDPMFRDLDGEPGITADGDRKILGFDRPNFRMGFSNTVSYKNFTFYALLNGVFGGNNQYLGVNPRQNSYQNRSDFNEVENGPFWTPENQSTTNLRPGVNDARYIGLQSRGFVRLQNVNLSYRFDADFLRRLNVGLTSLELYGNADNPFIETDWFGGGDPEYSENGARGIVAQSGILPVMSAYTFGLNASF
ncbi:MAG: SusC/RagA family TonB-linked outer membrane protein [Flavobacteriaceae bacterium]